MTDKRTMLGKGMYFSKFSKNLASDLLDCQRGVTSKVDDYYTLDMTSVIGEQAQMFMDKLKRISIFAKEHGMTKRAVLRHCYLGNLPSVIICGVPFVVDLGEQLYESQDHETTREAKMILHRIGKLTKDNISRR